MDFGWRFLNIDDLGCRGHFWLPNAWDYLLAFCEWGLSLTFLVPTTNCPTPIVSVKNTDMDLQ